MPLLMTLSLLVFAPALALVAAWLGDPEILALLCVATIPACLVVAARLWRRS